MKNCLLIALALLISLQAVGQTRPGSGPDADSLPVKELAKQLTDSVNTNAKDCGTTQHFKNIVTLQTYISIKNVSASGKKDCSEVKPKVAAEVKCLFKSFATTSLTELLKNDGPTVNQYLISELDLDEEQAKEVVKFYRNINSYLDNE